MRLIETFARKYGSHDGCRIAVAPGRVNLIGEHTDYNDGLVLPMAIDRWIRICFRPNHSTTCHLYSLTRQEEACFDLASLTPGVTGWISYPMGMAWALQQAGFHLQGFDAVLDGDIPMGAGLSSSAALEVATGLALQASASLAMDKWTIARHAQKAENDFVGVKCGIMDQFASVFGQKNAALLLDCRSLEHQHVRFGDTGNLQVIICNTGVHHALADSEYNMRRKECEAAIKLLLPLKGDATHLRDFSIGQMQAVEALLPDPIRKRARHVISENRRVEDMVHALANGDIRTVGRLMRSSHISLRDDYEVSCRELDILTELAWEAPGCIGARMTGGGFGGCTVNLVESTQRDAFVKHVCQGYRGKTGRVLAHYACRIVDGAHLRNLP